MTSRNIVHACLYKKPNHFHNPNSFVNHMTKPLLRTVSNLIKGKTLGRDEVNNP